MSAPAEGIPPEQGSSTYQAEKVKRAGKKNEERRRVAEAEIQRLLLRAVAVADAFCASTVGGYVEELQEDYEAQSIVPDADSTKLCRLQLESAKYEHTEISELAGGTIGRVKAEDGWVPSLLASHVILEGRCASKRSKVAAAERAKEQEREGFNTAKELLDERWTLSLERMTRADTLAKEEFEQGKIIGEGPAKIMVDAKRKSDLLQKADALSRQTQELMQQTQAYKDLQASLVPNDIMNAANFLDRAQPVLDEIKRIQGQAQSPMLMAKKESEELKFLWAHLDSDNSGALDTDEFGTLMREMGRSLSKAELTEAMQSMDSDNSGKIEFDEFLGWWNTQDHAAQAQLTKHTEGMAAMWRAVDKDGSGQLDATEVRGLLEQKGMTLSDEDFAETMQELDQDQSGTVELPEFLKWWGQQSVEAQDDMKLAQLGQLHADVQSEFDALASESDAVRKATSETSARRLWDEIDVDKSGSLDVHEVRDLLAAMGNDFTISFTEKGTIGIRFAEDSFSGSVVVVSLVDGSQASKHKQLSGGEVLRRVGKTDVVGAKYRDVIEAIQSQPERPLLMSFSGVGLSQSEVQSAMNEMDTDNDGTVDYDEFLIWYEKQDAESKSRLESRTMVQKQASVGFVESISQLVVGYIKSAVAGLDLPNISGTKDWGAYEITGLAVKEIFIEAENVKVDVGEHLVIKAQNVQSIFEEFSWKFKKETFPKMEDTGAAHCKMVDLCVTITMDLCTNEACAVVVQNTVPSIALGALEAQVIGGSHTWLYNKLIKVFSERIKVTVVKEMMAATGGGVSALEHTMTNVTQKFFGGGQSQ